MEFNRIRPKIMVMIGYFISYEYKGMLTNAFLFSSINICP